MQKIPGFSPVEAGAAFLPMTGLMIVIAPLAGRLSDRIALAGALAAVATVRTHVDRADAAVQAPARA